MTATLAARLRAIVDELDAHVAGNPTATLASIASDLDSVADDVEQLAADASPFTAPRCLPCRNGNHTGGNGTPGCVGDFCACPCRSES